MLVGWQLANDKPAAAFAPNDHFGAGPDGGVAGACGRTGGPALPSIGPHLEKRQRPYFSGLGVGNGNGALRRSRWPMWSNFPVLSSSQLRRDSHAWRGGVQESLHASSADNSDFHVLSLFGILFKLWKHGIQLIPRVCVAGPHIHLRVKPTRIIQARNSDRGKLRDCVGFDDNRRAAVRAKAPTGHAARVTR